jgi:hypothetical protein
MFRELVARLWLKKLEAHSATLAPELTVNFASVQLRQTASADIGLSLIFQADVHDKRH